MESEQAAFLAAQSKHHRYMVFGKKQRYIEVFQCSGEDMRVVLSGGLPAQRPVVSPGMLMWDQSGSSSQPSQGFPSAGSQRSFVASSVLPFPSTAPPAVNGALMTNLVTPQIKPEQMLMPSSVVPTQIRHPTILQQQPLDIAPPQAQASSLLASIKPIKVAGAAATPQAALHPAILGQYGDLNLAAAQSGLVLIPGGAATAKIPFVAPNFAATAPQMSYVSVSSAAVDAAAAAAQTYQQPKYSLATNSILPCASPVAPTVSVGHQGNASSSSGKRSYEQAFTGDQGSRPPLHKRPPPARYSSPTAAGATPRLSIPPPQFNAQFNPAAAAAAAAAAQPLGAASLAAPMITTFYPPPTMYPPTAM